VARTRRLRGLLDYRAVLFDLDGVLTRTAQLHAAAWTRMFDELLRRMPPGTGAYLRPFDADQDYRHYLDGRRRYDGVSAFLASRGIKLPYGVPQDGPKVETVCGLGNRKEKYFHEALRRQGVEVYDDAVALARAAHTGGLKLAVVSASESCGEILDATGLRQYFDAVVTGVDARERHLAGKPAPDTYLAAARQLGVPPVAGVILEDAVAGIRAGIAGRFGLVVGVDRRGDPDALSRAGAHLVVKDLRSLLSRPGAGPIPDRDPSPGG
jgi:beta-phosphoglucomutase family hydrolase